MLAAAALIFALGGLSRVFIGRRRYTKGVQRLVHAFRRTGIARVLFGRFDDRHAVWQAVLDRGVLIRETGPDGWLRVSIGTPAEMEAFKQALTEVASR